MNRYVTDITKLAPIPAADREKLHRVTEKYAFRVSEHYLSLIDWDDPDDPLRRIVVPAESELVSWGELDASNEAANTVAKGVQHKYPHTVLLLCNEICAAYCRYCFRKRLFMNENDEVSLDISAGIKYIAEHPQVTNVLLTGGDPFVLGTRRLTQILRELRDIPHVQIIRVGSKIPAFNPHRILDDNELQGALSTFSSRNKRIYLMGHFDHPRELSSAAINCIDCLLRCGVVCVNQCPILKGINDDAKVLAELFRKLSFIGAPQYYLFQGRPTAGNLPFAVTIVRGYQLFEESKKHVSGLAKRARFVMSHATGKIEVVGVDERYMFLHYHRAKNPADEGRFMIFHRNDQALWLDDLQPASLEGPATLGAATELAANAALAYSTEDVVQKIPDGTVGPE